MITQGFAAVKHIEGSEFKSQLVERLALEAAIEYFRDEWPDLYDTTLSEFLYSQQNDASAFGKSAEWFLAWVSCLDGLIDV
jgi:hypothetical protein